jgi:hypothetical protein
VIASAHGHDAWIFSRRRRHTVGRRTPRRRVALIAGLAGSGWPGRRGADDILPVTGRIWDVISLLSSNEIRPGNCRRNCLACAAGAPLMFWPQARSFTTTARRTNDILLQASREKPRSWCNVRIWIHKNPNGSGTAMARAREQPLPGKGLYPVPFSPTGPHDPGDGSYGYNLLFDSPPVLAPGSVVVNRMLHANS